MALPRGVNDERNTNPAKGGEVVVNDTPFTKGVCRALWVGGAGAVSVTFEDGTTATLSAVAAGYLLPVQCSQVNASGTTATLIVALF